MSGQIKAKVTPRFNYDRSRPPSPIKTLPSNPSPTPGARPRAKINSAANVTVRKPATSVSTHNLDAATASTTTTRTPVGRAPSPFKPTQARAPQTSNAVPQVKAKISTSARMNAAAASAPSPPELRQRALTAVSDVSARTRRGSLSSHVSSSSNSIPSRNIYSPPKLTLNSSNEENHSASSSVVSTSGGGQVKFKSKVSKLADHSTHTPPSIPSSPSFPPHTRPTRVPSGSNLSLSPPLGPSRSAGLSPVSAPGHTRFATTREAPSPKAGSFRAFAPLDDSAVTYSSSAPARVDPAQIPLPPQSPQMSAVSFSSRSSVSCGSRGSDTSGSSAPTLHHRVNGHIQVNGKHARSRSSADVLGVQFSPLSSAGEPSRDSPSPSLEREDDKDSFDDEHGLQKDDNKKLRKEAISNRKIADLEITNKSLMAINSSLEAAKHRQAKEIRDLRRKLRESILVLPPSAYRAAKTTLTPEEPEEAEEAELEDDDEEDEDEAQAAVEGKSDETYRRVRSMLETLIDSGRRALESKPEDFRTSGVGITKVLSEEEARSWRGEDVSFTERDFTDDAATDDDPSRPLTPSRVAIPDDFSSEEEVERSIVLDRDSFEMSSVPPITVTPSLSP